MNEAREIEIAEVVRKKSDAITTLLIWCLIFSLISWIWLGWLGAKIFFTNLILIAGCFLFDKCIDYRLKELHSKQKQKQSKEA